MSWPNTPQTIPPGIAGLTADIRKLIPPMDLIPKEYKSYSRSWGTKLFNDLFFYGLDDLKLVPKPGIDSDKAFRQIDFIARSWDPSREHKTAACAYLFELWFESATWKAREKSW